MFLYHLALQRPTGITQACVGSFSAPKVQELVCARGDFLELLRPDESGKVQTVLRRVPARSRPAAAVNPRGSLNAQPGAAHACLRPLTGPPAADVRSTPLFGCIRAIAAFRLTGANRVRGGPNGASLRAAPRWGGH